MYRFIRRGELLSSALVRDVFLSAIEIAAVVLDKRGERALPARLIKSLLSCVRDNVSHNYLIEMFLEPVRIVKI